MFGLVVVLIGQSVPLCPANKELIQQTIQQTNGIFYFNRLVKIKRVMKYFHSKLKETIDPGFGTKFQQNAKRLINKDGSFNVIRRGVGISSRNIYQDLLKMTWSKFFLTGILLIFSLNALFTLIYLSIGLTEINGILPGNGFLHDFSQAFYFSFQTFTTVGYGRISPIGDLASLVAAFEAMVGLMSFALFTGLLYGRFSRPNISLEFSNKAIIAPYRDGIGLMFRIANRRHSLLINLRANVSLTYRENLNGQTIRKYFILSLERNSIMFFPTSWTIVHPIDSDSPFNEMDLRALHEYDFEIMIQMEGFDETFGNTVHSRYSYLPSEIEVGAKFRPAFHTDDIGNVVINIHHLHDFDNLELPQIAPDRTMSS